VSAVRIEFDYDLPTVACSNFWDGGVGEEGEREDMVLRRDFHAQYLADNYRLRGWPMTEIGRAKRKLINFDHCTRRCISCYYQVVSHVGGYRHV